MAAPDDAPHAPAPAVETPAVAASAALAHGSSGYRRFAAALLLIGFATFGLLYDVQPLMPLFAHQFAVDAASASLVVSFATGAMALAFLPAGVLSDRVGRRPVILASLTVSALLTIASAVLPGWHTLLAMRALIGIALAGVPSVAMAYVAEEVEPRAVGSAMGLYVAGTAIGGMAGRLGMTMIADLGGWRPALAAMGVAGLLVAALFATLAPPARAFAPVHHDRATIAASVRRLFGDRVLRLIYVEAFLLMGAFVAIYNYAGFRLQAPPYSLSQTAVGCIFLLYLLGSFSSAWFGGLAGRRGRARLFWMPVAAMIAGIALTCAIGLPLIVLGIAIVTAAFFAAHSTASGWVGQRAIGDRAQAAAFYLLFYYLGASLLGAAGGVAWELGGWTGVAVFAGMLVVLALAIAVRLIRAADDGIGTSPVAHRAVEPG